MLLRRISWQYVTLPCVLQMKKSASIASDAVIRLPQTIKAVFVGYCCA